MKKITINSIICIIVSFLLSQSTFADWTAGINANRDDNNPFVNFGVSDEIIKIPNAPEPPTFKCFMHILSPEQDTEYFKTIIYKKGKLKYHWILAVNPHGSTGPITTTANVFWDSNQLGPGKFSIIEGTDSEGSVIVSDMKSQSNFDASTDKNKYLYYSIVNTPDLSDLIGSLRILSGFNVKDSVFFVDLDKDGKTELADSIYMIRHLAMNP